MSLFEQATKSHLRFKSVNGLVSVEDLWDLTLATLDTIAKGLRKELREEDESFIDNTKANAQLETKFEVVKAVIASKIADRDAYKARTERSARKQQIMSVLEQKKTDSLQNMSKEELEKELAAL